MKSCIISRGIVCFGLAVAVVWIGQVGSSDSPSTVQLMVTPGTNVTLLCTNSSQTATPIYWQYYGAHASTEKGTTTSVLQELGGKNDLVIPHFGCRDRGTYVCFVRSSPRSPAMVLNTFSVLFPSLIPIGARFFSARLMTGRVFKLFCAAQEVEKLNSPLVFKWDQGGRPVAERGSLTYRYINKSYSWTDGCINTDNT